MQNINQKTDVIIVGAGISGLYTALNLPKHLNIVLICKSKVEESNSFLAQGGISCMRDQADYLVFMQDTLSAGHHKNDVEAVAIMIRNSQNIINHLIELGVNFEKDTKGNLLFTKEGAHSVNRIAHFQDITGKEITSKLLYRVREQSNITLLENLSMIDIIEENKECIGIIAINQKKETFALKSHYTVFACGGIGGLYKHSTNYPILTGDAIAIAIRHNILLKDMSYVQMHPTALYTKKRGRRFLISESLRGEGAILYNKNHERFVDELLPRDLLCKAIFEQMEKDKMPYVLLSLEKIPKAKIIKHFPNIYNRCLEENYDITLECIPVTPAQHFLMGGIKVDLDSKTTLNRLYAVGETSCNGVHGANRLASNSLLESLVFSKRAAENISKTFTKTLLEYDKGVYNVEGKACNFDCYKKENANLIFKEIERKN